MKHRYLASLALVILATSAFPAGSAPAPAAPSRSVARPASTKVKDFTIVAIEGRITPDVIRVRRGDLVRLTFKVKDGKYGVSIPALKIKANATPERPYYVEFAASSEGEYEMRCTKVWSVKHWSENGKIVVE